MIKKTPAPRPRNWEKLTKRQRKLEISNKEACLKVIALENKLAQGNFKNVKRQTSGCSVLIPLLVL